MSLYVLVSGYGPFLNIKHNPADELGQIIAQQFGSMFQNTNIKLLTYESLAVTSEAVDALMVKWGQEIAAVRNKEPNSRFLTINIGVNANIKERVMHFERYCFNGRCFVKNDPNSFLNSDEKVYDHLDLAQR